MAKKKILLLSDDLRLTSGIATVSRDMVIGTVDHYDWFQIGAAINHPDKGKIMDLSEDASKITGVSDASVKILCNDGYGDPLLLRRIIEQEKPDAILHFTDPRFWDWLYAMEHEIRQTIPLMYLNIWDGAGFIGDTPTDPMWNKDAYASCDLLMAISKQTYGINKRILEKIGQNNDSNRITYVPHGIDTEMYYPINEESSLWDALTTQRNSLTDGNDDKFIVLWNNRNIHRKHPGDVVLAYKHFCQLVDKAGFNAQNDCMLVMHTNPMDPNGTDLFSVVNNLCNEYAVTFSDKVVSGDKLNILLNCSDVVVNMASNEGFGLATAEAMSAGIPVVVNVTGGLQDQCGFINPKTLKYFTADDYVDIHTLHRKDIWGDLKHGEWVKPVWPSNISLQGSIPTPYIFDDRADYRDIGNALFEWFLVPKNKRKEFGMLGRQFILNSDASGMSKKDMSNRIASSINNCIEKFTKRERFDLFIA